MAKHSKDTLTAELPLVKRGRPVSDSTLTPVEKAAERQRVRRAKLAEHGVSTLTVELPVEVLDGLREYMKFKNMTKNVIIEKLIRQQLLRKR